MKLWNGLLTVIAGGLLVASVNAVMQYWQYDVFEPDVAKLMAQSVSAEQLTQHIQQAIKDDNPDDVRMYLQIAKTFSYPIKAETYAADLAAMDSTFNTVRRNVNEFANGFIDGNANSATSVAGALAADFTVVGDVRDLWEQYQRYSANQPVDELVVTLAGAGVGLTAVTVLSAGTAAPEKSGVSLTKLAKRAGSLTPNFQKYLLKQSSDVFDYKTFLMAAGLDHSLDGISKAAVRAYNPQAIADLQKTAGQVNTIRKASSTADTVHLLKYVESAEDLVQVEKLTVKYGKQSKGILKMVGRSALVTTKVLRKSLELMVSLLASVVSALGSLFSLRMVFQS